VKSAADKGKGISIMKWLMILFGCVFLLFGGCQEVSHNKSSVDVIIEDGGEFPPFLVGKWKDKEQGWEIVFEPDGTISSALMGPIDKVMKPGQVTTVETITGGKGVYEPGEWMVDYSPTSRELTVKISLKNFYFELGDGLLEGDCIDIFAGPISQDGNVWQVEWFSFPHYIIRTPQTSPYVELDLRDNGFTTNLTFEKIAPNAVIFEKVVPQSH
jgi:hypothetical protein